MLKPVGSHAGTSRISGAARAEPSQSHAKSRRAAAAGQQGGVSGLIGSAWRKLYSGAEIAAASACLERVQAAMRFEAALKITRFTSGEHARAQAITTFLVPAARAVSATSGSEMPLRTVLQQVSRIMDEQCRHETLEKFCHDWFDGRTISPDQFIRDMRFMKDFLVLMPRGSASPALVGLAHMFGASPLSAEGNKAELAEILAAYRHLSEGEPLRAEETDARFVAALAASACKLDMRTQKQVAGALLDRLPVARERNLSKDGVSESVLVKAGAYAAVARLIDSCEGFQRESRFSVAASPLTVAFQSKLKSQCSGDVRTECGNLLTMLRGEGAVFSPTLRERAVTRRHRPLAEMVPEKARSFDSVATI
ncbi:hypothetical protein FJU08_20995 [Martelella alba]|uniref:Uncharacterized protein n=1 Tax=Martelella alba TaxID=2590451 RepID=A0A506U277_9HYPH|nr:hypothetical protein [Martelella alba]TPW27085.1 hypothetical protein FJU08_20995 [Martelella alba]